MKIGFAGLGVMGGPMARHLVRAGHTVAGFNRSPDKARAWADAGGGTRNTADLLARPAVDTAGHGPPLHDGLGADRDRLGVAGNGSRRFGGERVAADERNGDEQRSDEETATEEVAHLAPP